MDYAPFFESAVLDGTARTVKSEISPIAARIRHCYFLPCRMAAIAPPTTATTPRPMPTFATVERPALSAAGDPGVTDPASGVAAAAGVAVVAVVDAVVDAAGVADAPLDGVDDAEGALSDGAAD
jgi:hypothetical protein